MPLKIIFVKRFFVIILAAMAIEHRMNSAALSDLFSRRCREGISLLNLVERSIMKASLSRLCAVALALQKRALFEVERRAKNAEKMRE